ncbi:MAG TPA: HAD hydrolase-like protein, partial [Edaphobacter sp.]
VVGDTETDILFAKNANLLSCWATYGYGDARRCKALSPDFELHKLTDLPALITTSPSRASSETH